MFFNDVDWCRRVHEAGWKILYAPEIRVTHTGGASVNRAKVRMIWMGHLAYVCYLHRLYARRPLLRIIAWLSAAPLIVAALVRMVWWGMVGR
jgi:GT2 family glycosyltransferase